MSESMTLEQMKEFALENSIELTVGKDDRIGFKSEDELFCPHCGDRQDDQEMLHTQHQTATWATGQCWDCDRDYVVVMIPSWSVFDFDGDVDTSGSAVWLALGDLRFDWNDRDQPLEW